MMTSDCCVRLPFFVRRHARDVVVFVWIDDVSLGFVQLVMAGIIIDLLNPF